MKVIKVIIFGILTLSISTLTSCNKDSLKNCIEHEKSACNEDLNKTNIRILNNSKFDFCNVVVNPSGGASNYGIVEKSSTTCFHSFDLAYSYAYISLMIGDKEFTFEPDDYVGEPELGNGKFTYEIDILDFNSGTLSITTSKN